jgi:N6-L-threonylcarbamoyladenine synthase
MRVLGIESSCDETSVACVDAGGVRSNLVSSQVDLHARFGGVVPELASRAHLRNIIPVLDAALQDASWSLGDVEGIAATSGPGLIGAVLMGLSCAKALAWAKCLPFVGIHHIEGHILANGIESPMALPALVLVVSGGHTQTVLTRAPGSYEILGSTRDDAAGETLDKTAKLMGLGYPGGPLIEKMAARGRPSEVELPVGLRQRDELDFSFSGLKTAVRLRLQGLGEDVSEQEKCDLARALQDSVIKSLMLKTAAALQACQDEGIRGLYLAGGVAANGPLRSAFAMLAAERGLSFRPPPLRYCTDNAAMIAWAGRLRLLAGQRDPLALAAFARGALPQWAQ